MKNEHPYMPENHMEKLYSSRNPLVRFVHNDRLRKIVSNLPCKTGLNILDAGCGEGHLIEKMHENNPDCRYFGFDITDIALEKARQRCPYGLFYNMDLRKIDFPENFFNVIVCTEVLEHIKEYEKVINEFKRILKNGGYLIVTFPNEIPWTIARFFLGRRPVKVVDHINSFYPKTMKDLIGMDVEKLIKLPFDLPLPLALGSLMKFKKYICAE